MKKELTNIIKCLSGNVLLIGIDEQYIYDEIENNDKIISCDSLTKYKKKKLRLFSKDSCEVSKKKTKSIKIKKLRKIYKKKKIDFIICNIVEIEKYLKSFVSNSVYINKNMLYIYGSNIDTDDIISKYKRYNTIVQTKKFENNYIIFIDNIKSKNNFFFDLIYYIYDSLIDLRNIIADILVG